MVRAVLRDERDESGRREIDESHCIVGLVQHAAERQRNRRALGENLLAFAHRDRAQQLIRILHDAGSDAIGALATFAEFQRSSREGRLPMASGYWLLE